MKSTKHLSGTTETPSVLGKPNPWADTREWLQRVDSIGELRTVSGLNTDPDIGQVAEMLDHSPESPAVLIDDVAGFPKGFRVLVNASGTSRRQAITLGLDPSQATAAELRTYWRSILDDIEPVEPVEVSDGPILENVLEGADVDLSIFPTPQWHPQDGGRFIGTASMNILRDPKTGWVNVGTYRNQIFGRDTMGIWISPGKHGRLISENYLDKGEPCPVVVVVGADPLLFMASCAEGTAYGTSEFAWAGAVRGAPVEVVRGRHTGLPIPATAEIAIEGFIEPGPRHPEGPYGEFHGYYTEGVGSTPCIRVKAIYHRNDPILLGCPQGKPPHEDNQFLAPMKSALIEQQLSAAGVPGVTGVWCPPEAGSRFVVVVSINQMYPGHATQALSVASQCGTTAYAGRYVIVVDDDIDVTVRNEVLWAVTTRCDPARDITTTKRAWSTPIDPALHRDDKSLGSRLLIDATRPWEWKEQFAPVVVSHAETVANRDKWGWILEEEHGPTPS